MKLEYFVKKQNMPSKQGPDPKLIIAENTNARTLEALTE